MFRAFITITSGAQSDPDGFLHDRNLILSMPGNPREYRSLLDGMDDEHVVQDETPDPVHITHFASILSHKVHISPALNSLARSPLRETPFSQVQEMVLTRPAGFQMVVEDVVMRNAPLAELRLLLMPSLAGTLRQEGGNHLFNSI